MSEAAPDAAAARSDIASPAPIRSVRVSFPGRDGLELAGIVDQPAGACWAHTLLMHCFTCTKDLKALHRISRGLAARGIAVLRFDFAGLGQSAGDFAETNFTTNIEDILAAAAYLRENFGPPAALIGHSLGGTAALAAARRVADCRAVATIAAPSEPRHLGDVLLRRNPRLLTDGEGDVQIGGQTYRVRRQLIEDLQANVVRDAIAALGRPLLVLHSPADKTVGIGAAHEIFNLARHPKSLVCLDGADHLMTRARDTDYVVEVLAGWLRRHLADDLREF